MKGKLVSLFLLPVLLLSCGALWQTDVPTAIEQARTGKYKEAAARLEQAVAGGNVDPQVVESLYYSWIRQGEYTVARDKFEAWSMTHANAGPIRLAAGRINHLTGNFDRALAHLNPIQNSPNVAIAAQYEKACDAGQSPERGRLRSLG